MKSSKGIYIYIYTSSCLSVCLPAFIIIRSDEDAFTELLRRGPGGGVGILVSSKPKETAASFHLTGPDQVKEFLLALAKEAQAVGITGSSSSSSSSSRIAI